MKHSSITVLQTNKMEKLLFKEFIETLTPKDYHYYGDLAEKILEEYQTFEEFKSSLNKLEKIKLKLITIQLNQYITDKKNGR